MGEVSVRVTHRSHPCVTLWCDYTLLSLQGTFHPNNFHARDYLAFLDEQSDETLVMASLRIPKEYQGLKAPSCFSSPNSGPRPPGFPSVLCPHPLLPACTRRCSLGGFCQVSRPLLCSPRASQELGGKYPLCSSLCKTKRRHKALNSPNPGNLGVHSTGGCNSGLEYYY